MVPPTAWVSKTPTVACRCHNLSLCVTFRNRKITEPNETTIFKKAKAMQACWKPDVTSSHFSVIISTLLTSPVSPHSTVSPNVWSIVHLGSGSIPPPIANVASACSLLAPPRVRAPCYSRYDSAAKSPRAVDTLAPSHRRCP